MKANFSWSIWGELGHDEYRLLSDIPNNDSNLAIPTMIVLWYIFPICKIGYSPTHMHTDIYCKQTSYFYSLWTRHIYYNIQYSPGIDALAGCWDKYLCAEQILLIDLSTASSSLSQLICLHTASGHSLEMLPIVNLDEDCEEKMKFWGKSKVVRRSLCIYVFPWGQSIWSREKVGIL